MKTRLPQIKRYLLWVFFSFLVLWFLLALSMWSSGMNGKEFFAAQLDLGQLLIRHPFSWVLAHVPLLLYLSLRNVWQLYQQCGAGLVLRRLALVVLLPLVLGILGWKYADWYTQERDYAYDWDHSIENGSGSALHRYKQDGKIRGVHYFGSRRFNGDMLTPITKNNIEWVVLVPYGYQQEYDSPDMRISRGNRNGQSRSARYTEFIEEAKELNLQVMMKPHIWMGRQSGGKWRSDIEMTDEASWKAWQANYRAFILQYAKMSEEQGLPFFCIGAELHMVVKKQPEFWRELIKEVRTVYSGKLTYGANWYQEYEDVTFWDELDYIGIQAYFPLTKKENPTVDELVKGWKPHVKKIEAMSKRYKKPILFTEIGYKSSRDAAIEPWAWASSLGGLYEKVSTETQANCYEAFFRVFWKKEWFAGALFWEWKGYDGSHNSRQSINFTPYNKPAANVMAKWFGRLGKTVSN